MTINFAIIKRVTNALNNLGTDPIAFKATSFDNAGSEKNFIANKNFTFNPRIWTVI